MKRAMIFAAIAIAQMASADEAVAPAFSPVLSAEEARAELYGVDLSGVLDGESVAWRECIDPKGRTLFFREGEVSQGEMRIRGDGAACFDYGRGSHCFRVTRAENAGYVFWGVERFVATSVRRGVEACVLHEATS